jgi:enolase-phosphatase E1
MRQIQGIVLDIEGTITDIRFVADVLFPYAREHMPTFLAEHAHEDEVADALDAARVLLGDVHLSLQSLTLTLDGWMAEDRKIGPLKTLQGLLWRRGYEGGDFKGHLYEEVVPTLEHWKALGLGLYIYSSGSVEAQKLLMRYSTFGDVSALFTGHADTSVGAKTEASSYARLAAEFGYKAREQELLFLSDNPKELMAAKEAGFQIGGIDRTMPSQSSRIADEGWTWFGGLEGVHAAFFAAS